MKIKLKIQQKIQIFIISSALVIYLFSIGFISIKAKNKALKDAVATADIYAKEAANKVKAQMDADMQIVRTLAQAFHTYSSLTNEEWKKLYKEMYYEVFRKNEHIYSIWDSWELSVIDSSWNDPFGRYVISYWREKGEIESLVELRSLEGDPEMYAKVKRLTSESAWEPYFDVFTEGKSEKNLMTSMSSPIIKNGRYVGLVAIDITLKRLQEIIQSIHLFEGGYAFLVSSGGKIVAHPDVNQLNKTIDELFPDDNRKYRLDVKVKGGKGISYTNEDTDGFQTYYTYAPIEILGTTTPWSIGISVPISSIMAEANRDFKFSLLIGVIGIVLMAIIISVISHSITNPISKITKLLNQLATGKIDHSMLIQVDSGDEIADMAEALNVSVNGLISKKEFAQQIGKGNLDAKIKLLGMEDSLGQSLVDMRDSLISAKKEEVVRQKGDEIRRWANEGVASFGEILRQNNDKISVLANEIVKHLTNYLKANQGGLFILNDEDGESFFELVAAFAYNRKKYIEKKILPGEGLVGTCALEKETIYMTQVPEEYIEITSGLGGANPTSLLIVPLKLEDEVLGVLEIASFNKLENYEIEFVERVAQSMASTLRSVKINERTTYLLEQSQQQAEEMAAQEEEMRQNMEELQATQEEAARKTMEMEGFMNALNTSSYVVQYDIDGHVIEVNESYLVLLGLKREELIGSHYSDRLVFESGVEGDDNNEFWLDLKSGKSRRERTRLKLKNKEYVFMETYTPILNEHGEVYKILKIAQNITEFVGGDGE